VPVLVIGGQALPAYGVVRQTVDLDCLVADEDLERLDALLRQGGFRVEERTAIFSRYRHPDPLEGDVDLLAVDRETMDAMYGRGRELRLDAISLRVPSLPHLIALKLHAARNDPRRFLRDLADIADLRRANPDLVSTDELRGLCERYGPPGSFGALEGRT
jgi:hypothetical protein